MPIITEEVTATASITDHYDVEVWQVRKRRRYTVEQAREFAAEILAACEDVDLAREQDRAAELQRANNYPKPGPVRPRITRPF